MKYVEYLMYVLLAVSAIVFVYTFFGHEPVLKEKHTVVDVIPAMQKHIGRNEKLIMIALTPNCSYCLQSLPFYKTLLEQRKDEITVVAAIDTSMVIELQKRLLERQRVFVDTLIGIPTQEWGIHAVPTIISLNEFAEVKNVWIGLLDEIREEEVLSIVR